MHVCQSTHEQITYRHYSLVPRTRLGTFMRVIQRLRRSLNGMRDINAFMQDDPAECETVGK